MTLASIDPVGWTLRSLPLLAAGLIVASMCRRTGPAVRHAVLTAGLLGCLLLPAAELLDLGERVSVPELGMGAVTNLVTRSAPSDQSFGTSVPPGSSLEESTRGENTLPANLPPASDLIVLIWALGALLLVGRQVLHLARARTLVARASPARRTPSVLSGGRSCSEDHHVRLLVSADANTPFTTGVFRPAVVLPPEATGWPAERFEIVARHELAHCRRHDALWIGLGVLARSLFWWNPLAWLAARKQKLEAERAADAWVVRSGIDPARYVDEMVQLARQALFRVHVPGIAATGAGTFEQRMRSLLEPGIPRGRIGTGQLAAVVAGGVALTLGLSALAPGAASAGSIQEPWVTVSADGRSLTIPVGATVRFQGSGSLVFRDGRRVVRIPEDARIRIPGVRDPRSGSFGPRVSGVEILGASGELRWTLTPVASLPVEPGTRIADSGRTGQASIETAQPTVFYLQVVDENSTVFFEPASTP